MNRKMAAVALLLAALALAGCAPSLEDRVAERDACVAAGGKFTEWVGFFGERAARCNLSTDL